MLRMHTQDPMPIPTPVRSKMASADPTMLKKRKRTMTRRVLMMKRRMIKIIDQKRMPKVWHLPKLSTLRRSLQPC